MLSDDLHIQCFLLIQLGNCGVERLLIVVSFQHLMEGVDLAVQFRKVPELVALYIHCVSLRLDIVSEADVHRSRHAHRAP